MNPTELYDKVEAHPDISWVGVRHDPGDPPEEAEVFIRHSTGRCVALPISSVIKHSWEEIEGVLTGRRGLVILTHLARIVGYFSLIRNWNRSKVEEQCDRGKGMYAVPEGKFEMEDADLPDDVIKALMSSGREAVCDVAKLVEKRKEEKDGRREVDGKPEADG